ncbi:hypothetical protein ACFXPX_40575 [Kitasatospora sp. NPDC059146]|uniref:hypothetical protein n=1 Tax=unclassified Kitasatospora TaxID=2633591 RepID=UPI00367AC83F
MGKKSELDDLRARVATLEAEVDRLRGEAAAAGRAPAVTAGQPQSMTRIADAVGVMVSGGRAEQPTRVLQARTGSPERRTVAAPQAPEAPEAPEPAETRSLPVPAHGQFLESLLSGR